MNFDEDDTDDFYDDMFVLGILENERRRANGQKPNGSCLMFLLALGTALIGPIVIAASIFS